METPLHPFERNARKNFERQARAAAHVLGCDVSHVILMASEYLRVTTENIEKGRRDGASDIRAARGETDHPPAHTKENNKDYS